MSFVVSSSTKITVTGDSITEGPPALGPLASWVDPPGCLRELLTNAVGKTVPILVPFTKRRATVGQPVLPYGTAPVSGKTDNISGVYGVGGRNVAGLQADLQNSIYEFGGDIVIIEITTNDFSAGTLPANVATSAAAIMDGIHQNLPNAKILWLSPPVRFESWTAGPHLSDGLDTWAAIPLIQAQIAAVGFGGVARSTYTEYVDLLAPALTYLVANNTAPPGPPTGLSPFKLTVDQIHPTVLGMQMMSQAVMAHFTLI